MACERCRPLINPTGVSLKFGLHPLSTSHDESIIPQIPDLKHWKGSFLQHNVRTSCALRIA
jgi:hypothetical protein